jgi:chitin disaccharide deacetylase
MKRKNEKMRIRNLVSMLPAHAQAPQQASRAVSRRLIVTADDYGMASFIDRGIRLALRDGLVNTVSAMVTFPRAMDALNELRRERPDSPVGLHLCLTAGRPCARPHEVPTLLDEQGRFFPVEVFLARFPRMALCEISHELTAQIQAFKRSGFPLDHLSYHQNAMALHPMCFREVLRLAQSHRVPIRVPVGSSRQDRRRFQSRGTRPKTVAIALGASRHNLWATARLFPYVQVPVWRHRLRKLRATNLRQPDYFIDHFYGDPSPSNLLDILRNLPPGSSELLTHPGMPPYDDPLPHGLDPAFVAPREAELATLLSPYIRDQVEALGIELITFGDLTTMKGA